MLHETNSRGAEVTFVSGSGRSTPKADKPLKPGERPLFENLSFLFINHKSSIPIRFVLTFSCQALSGGVL